MVWPLIAREVARQVVRLVNAQDDILKIVLQSSPTRNVLGRGGQRGIRHGLAAGTIASPFIEQYRSKLYAVPTQNGKRPKTNNQYQKRGRNKYNTRSRNRYCRTNRSKYR